MTSETEEPAPAEPAPAEPAPAEPAEETEGSDGEGAGRVAQLEQEGEVAADYLEVLLDILDLDGDLDLDVEGDRAVVAIVGKGLDQLVGARGETLEALQELTRLAVNQRTGGRSRLMLDVGGHRERRRKELTSLGEAVSRRVLDRGKPEKLTPMSPFERKVVHDAVARSGAKSESEGEEPERRVVVYPA